MNPRAPRLTWPDPDRKVRDGGIWFVASSGQLRAPWRLSVYMAALVAATLMANAFVYPLLSLATSWMTTPPALYSWVMLIAVWAATVVALRQVDDRPWSDVALHGDAWRPGLLVRGSALGAATIVAVLLLLLTTGGAQLVWLQDNSGLAQWSAVGLRALLLLAPHALWEELIFRGYLWRVAEDAGGKHVALIATSVAFGAVHITNPGANVQSLSIVVLAGVCLGLVRLVTNSVPAAWLAHLAWNLIMAGVAHAAVSGLPFEAVGWRLDSVGPAWWSGGGWGPEGGVASLLVLTAALSAYAVYARSSRQQAQELRQPHASVRATPTNIRSQSATTATSGSE